MDILFGLLSLRLLAGVYASITLLSIFLTAFDLHIGFTSRYLRLLGFVFDYGQQRLVAKLSAARLSSSAPSFHAGALTEKGADDDDDDSYDDDEWCHEETDEGNVTFLGINQVECQSDCSSDQSAETTPTTYPLLSASKSAEHIANNLNHDMSNNSVIIEKPTLDMQTVRQRLTLRHSTTATPQQWRSVPSSPEGPPIFLLGDNEFARRKRQFEFSDACNLIGKALTAIVDDQVTKRFYSRQLDSWNLLTRTNARRYQFVSFRVGLIWLSGCLIRYILLMPLRIMFALAGVLSLIACASIIGFFPEPLKTKAYRLISLISFRMLSKGFTATLTFHNRQFKPEKGDICVANHTSPIDVLVLACDNCYALVGQRHDGFLGVLERILSRATKHVWFDRSEVKDRELVLERLKEHVRAGCGPADTKGKEQNTDVRNTSQTLAANGEQNERYSSKNLPILIFPEGTCINNSAVMMFKKGSFEASDRICPVAIKYDLKYGDPFWNSSEQSYFFYLLMMMSSWAIKCDIWYLPPMTRFKNENSAEFANRVKHEIAKQGGFDELSWDGQLKRTPAKIEWKFNQQEDFASRFNLD